MSKKLWIPIVSVLVLIAGIYTFLKLYPPLETGTIASNLDQTLYLVGVGNRGLGTIQLVNVTVNVEETPTEAKVQTCDALTGFTLTDDYRTEELNGCGVRDLKDVVIKKGTSPAKTFAKHDEGTVTKEDLIYGVTVKNDLPIQTVNIEYRYFGIPLRKVVELD
ncbi:hypothetical protein PGH26_13380 [Sporosarcina jeotgali]|uniref:DUF4330 domain-containing protein n=1 Tax=Sporosarcina jeotgali TaxID=3020056 RepID=A0ABZ0KTV6_9BACL|nr:hypothetical protein [Sporosarcina sp. B2O-1]WOV83856.1 hypothetical protein PGH26_13380 [Sporosarcina sp. B2O-1]